MEDKYIVQIWFLIVGFLALVVCVIALSHLHSDVAILEMVRAGADPIEAKCAIVSTSINAICLSKL